MFLCKVGTAALFVASAVGAAVFLYSTAPAESRTGYSKKSSYSSHSARNRGKKYRKYQRVRPPRTAKVAPSAVKPASAADFRSALKNNPEFRREFERRVQEEVAIRLLRLDLTRYVNANWHALIPEDPTNGCFASKAFC